MANRETGHREFDINRLQHPDLIDVTTLAPQTTQEIEAAERATLENLLAELSPNATPAMIKAIIDSGRII